MRKLTPILAAVLAVCVTGGAARADDATEARLRDALRQAVSQQRALEDSQTQLQAKLSDQQKQIAALQAQLVQKEAAAQPAASPQAPQTPQVDRAEVERVVAEANQKIAAQNAALTEAGQTAEKWRTAYEQAAGVARAREAERARLAVAAEGVQQRAAACEAKNAALFKVGTEILDRLKAINVSEAMAAHEPFVGIKRVELQNLAQDEEDKLRDQQVQAGDTAHPAAQPAAQTTTRPKGASPATAASATGQGGKP